jgi:MFS family permease
MDRFGKGIRKGVRDAILSDEAIRETKGKIFGFHRSMDTLGAVIGPLFAFLFLYFTPQNYKTLFYIAFIPGLFAVLSSLLFKEKNKPFDRFKTRTPFFSFLSYCKESPASYKKLVTGLLIFTLFNSSNVFLLLKTKETGMNDTVVIGVYVFYNLIYALSAFPLGILADKIGLKTIFITGLVLFTFVYFGIVLNTITYFFFGLFFYTVFMRQRLKEYQKPGSLTSQTLKKQQRLSEHLQDCKVFILCWQVH